MPCVSKFGKRFVQFQLGLGTRDLAPEANTADANGVFNTADILIGRRQ
ncbi:MAG: hypothetical protein IPI17_16940 [Nitrosomonas sp.]|nr:hypothetical protein [Nitrosomonas sp.]